jgi:hypothetical protein
VKSRCARGRARLLPLLRERNPDAAGHVTAREEHEDAQQRTQAQEVSNGD